MSPEHKDDDGVEAEGPPARAEGSTTRGRVRRRTRADALRNSDAVLAAAIAVFKAQGVEAPVKEIADRAGVGVGTLYRHYPRRSDLIKAVFQREVDTCADAAATLHANEEPLSALRRWMDRYVELIATKRGLAGTLHSEDPAFDSLADYFVTRLEPALASLLRAAAANGDIRSDIAAEDLMRAVANVCQPADTVGIAYSLRMVALLVDGLRFSAKPGR